MKSLILCSLIASAALSAQTTVTPDTVSPPSAYNSMSTPPGEIPLGNGFNYLDEANTAPTSVPDSTSLIIAPNDKSVRQSQEEDPYDVNQLLKPERGASEEVNQSVEPKR